MVVAGDRPTEVVAFEESVVGFFMSAADLLGVPKSVAAIYGVCFASPEPIGFSEIQARLNISAGSISQGVRVLREVGALKVLKARGQISEDGRSVANDRRGDCYEPDLELRKLVAHFIEQRLDRQLDSGRGALQAIGKQVPGTAEGAKVLKTRLKALQTWHDKAHAVLPLVRTFLKLG